MKIIKTQKIAQRFIEEEDEKEFMSGANYGVEPDAEYSDEDNFSMMKRKGAGIYFSYMDEYPEGPFREIEKAKMAAGFRFKNWRDKQQALEKTHFFRVDRNNEI